MAVRLAAAVYQQMIDAFRERQWAHATFAEVARVTGVKWQKVSKAWHDGLSVCCGGGAPPIKVIAVEEQRTGIPYRLPGVGNAPIAPSALPVAVQGELVPMVPMTAPVSPEGPITAQDIEAHAMDALRQELRAIATVRDGAIGAAISARKMLAALQGRIDHMAEEIADQDARGVPINAVELSKMLHRILVVSQKASEITKQVIESERLALGSPTEIVKFTESKPAGDSGEAAARADRVLAFLAARHKERAADAKMITHLVEEDPDTALDASDAALSDTDLASDDSGEAEVD